MQASKDRSAIVAALDWDVSTGGLAWRTEDGELGDTTYVLHLTEAIVTSTAFFLDGGSMDFGWQDWRL